MALKHGVNLILAMIAAGIVRLLVPIELPTVIVVRSEEIMPSFQRFFSAQAFEMHGHSVNWLDIILAIWIVGSVMHLLLIAWLLFQQKRKIRRMRTEDHLKTSELVEELRRALKIGPKCRVVISSDVKTPMLVGYFSPIILLPPLALTEDDMRYVLLHELNHFIHRHLWIKLLFNAFCALLWWNPLVYMAKSDLDYILEVSCDRASVRGLDTKERIKYVEATSNVMKQLITLVTKSTLSVGFITAEPERIVQRCELILFPPKKISRT
ncbi:M56 family metallopeptidase, partial [Oscillibacter sp.]|uniref:M56 family metallopeptidase n=1 Tax=Oscillibacter sp. TaxID=1945593 RepID=UPI00289834E6